MAVLVGASGESEDLGPTGLLLMFTEKLDKWISCIACELVRSKFGVRTASLDSGEVNPKNTLQIQNRKFSSHLILNLLR